MRKRTKWQTKICNTFRVPKWTGLKMQAYTSNSKDWREELELLIDTVLSHIKNADTKMKFVTLWVGKEARTYLSTVEEDCMDSLRTTLNTLKDWTRPKSDENCSLHTSKDSKSR